MLKVLETYFEIMVVRDVELDRRNRGPRYLGGLPTGWFGLSGFSYPLVALSLYSDGIEIGPAGKVSRLMVPVWRAKYSEIEFVERLGSSRDDGQVIRGFRRGIVIVGGDWKPKTFWCASRDALCSDLARAGVVVT